MCSASVSPPTASKCRTIKLIQTGSAFCTACFSIRFYASVSRFCVSPTGGCTLEFSLTINLSVRCKLFAPVRLTQSVKRVQYKLFAEDQTSAVKSAGAPISCTGIPKGGFIKLSLCCWANERTASPLCVAIRATAIMTCKSVRSLLKRLFFRQNKEKLVKPSLNNKNSGSCEPEFF